MTEVGRLPDPAGPIGVVALSGPCDPVAAWAGLDRLRRCSREVIEASNLTDRRAFLAGDDDARLAGLNEVLDAGARIVLPLRGGYCVGRILPRSPWNRRAAETVTFIGYSDLTSALNHLVLLGGAIQVHGPMVSDLGRSGPDTERRCALLDGTPLDPEMFRFPAHRVLRSGAAEGRVMGGNLSFMASLAGTPEQPDLSGSILFLGDVNEPPCRLDRLLTQLRASGMFCGVKGLILGDLSGFSQQSDVAAKVLAESLLEAVSGPVVHGLPFSYGNRNRVFPLGGRVRLDTEDRSIVWRA